jgi:hypothetical protein
MIMTILPGLAKDFQWIVEAEDDKIVMIMIRILDDKRAGEIDDRGRTTRRGSIT